MVKHYTAFLDGKLVGKRSTAGRTYSHAYVIQWDREAHRSAAYGYVATDSDRKNFAYYTFVAAQGPKLACRPPGWKFDASYSEREIAEARRIIEGGYEAYVDRLRQKQIDHYKEDVARDRFEPHVAGWASRRDLAEKAARQFCSRGCRIVAIVPAVEVAKPVKSTKKEVA